MKQQPGLLRFVFRQSPSEMTGTEFHNDLLVPGMVSNDDPADHAVDGMTYLELDSAGRLVYFEARLAATARARERGDAAELECTSSPRPAWTHRSSNRPNRGGRGFPPTMHAPHGRDSWPRHYASAARRSCGAARQAGRVLSDRSVEPAVAGRLLPETGGGQVKFAMLAVLSLVMCIVPPVLASKNLKRGQGDRRSAFRLAAFLFAVQMALWLASVHLTLPAGTFGTFLVAVATSTFAGVVMWTVYLALEPYVRRTWPQTLIASTSVLSGRWQDPVVGRDVLTGVGMGVLWAVINVCVNWWHRGVDAAPRFDLPTRCSACAHAGYAVDDCAVRGAQYPALLLPAFSVACSTAQTMARRGAVFAAIFAALTSIGSSDLVWNMAVGLVIWGSTAVIVLRWGLLSLTGRPYFVDNVLLNTPATAHTGAWFIGNLGVSRRHGKVARARGLGPARGHRRTPRVGVDAIPVPRSACRVRGRPTDRFHGASSESVLQERLRLASPKNEERLRPTAQALR